MTEADTGFPVHTVSSNELSPAALDMLVGGLQTHHDPLYVRLEDNQILALIGYAHGEHEGTYELFVGGVIVHNGHNHASAMSVRLTPKALEDFALRMLALASLGHDQFRKAGTVWAVSAAIGLDNNPRIQFTSHITDCAADNDEHLSANELQLLQNELDKMIVRPEIIIKYGV